MAALGFPWYRATVASLETGRRRTLSAEELVALPYALSLTIGAGPITLRQLLALPTGTVVDLTPTLAVEGPNLGPLVDGSVAADLLAAMQAALYAEGVPFRPKLFDVDAEMNAAQRLGLSLDQLRQRAVELWGVSLSSRREALLWEAIGPGAARPSAEELRQRRREITRGLLTELRAHTTAKGGRRGRKGS